MDERNKNKKKVNLLSQDLESEMKKALTCLQMLQGNEMLIYIFIIGFI